MFNKILMSLVVLIFASSALAVEPAVTFSDVHARPTAGKVGIAFFTATSTKDDTITSVSSDCCKAVEIHRTEKLNGVMSMRRIATLTLKKKTPTRIQPDAKGGEHVMLIGLKEPLAEGDSVKVNITFSKAPAQTLVFPVKAATAAPTVHELH
jgi:periplasmic copper chaperone A